MPRHSSMRRVRRGRARSPDTGFIVTWDVNSVDRMAAHRVQYFIFGRTVTSGGRVYQYPGFVDREGVRYLGQSVVFVRPAFLQEIDAFLSVNGVDHEATRATIG